MIRLAYSTQALRAAPDALQEFFVADLDKTRLQLAQDVGATAVLSPDVDFVEQVMQLTGQIGAGVDTAIEVCMGRNETVKASIDSVRKGGTVVLVGNILTRR